MYITAYFHLQSGCPVVGQTLCGQTLCTYMIVLGIFRLMLTRWDSWYETWNNAWSCTCSSVNELKLSTECQNTIPHLWIYQLQHYTCYLNMQDNPLPFFSFPVNDNSTIIPPTMTDRTQLLLMSGKQQDRRLFLVLVVLEWVVVGNVITTIAGNSVMGGKRR